MVKYYKLKLKKNPKIAKTQILLKSELYLKYTKLKVFKEY